MCVNFASKCFHSINVAGVLFIHKPLYMNFRRETIVRRVFMCRTLFSQLPSTIQCNSWGSDMCGDGGQKLPDAGFSHFVLCCLFGWCVFASAQFDGYIRCSCRNRKRFCPNKKICSTSGWELRWIGLLLIWMAPLWCLQRLSQFCTVSAIRALMGCGACSLDGSGSH